MESCTFGVNLDLPCPIDCKNTLAKKTRKEKENFECIAEKKFDLFLQERVTFGVGVSAFLQAHPSVLEEFFHKSAENKELITYFLYINDPASVKDIIENFSPRTLAALFKSDFTSFKNIMASSPRDKRYKSIFKVKSYRYWTYINSQKICDTIVYFIREAKEAELAAQFLIILPSNIVSNLRDFTGFTPEEEIILYRALGDEIYELPIQTPQIYDHMISLFADDIEIFMILSTMEELIKRQKQILELTEKLLIYTEKNRIDLSIQFIYSELNGLEIGTASEILNQMQEKQMITTSQRELILSFLKNGSLDILKRLRNDLL
ncbi:hypothetical protein EHQ58_07355 [Leptospira ognonensis]|uniref:Uncharacterized protein n=1 Tax=Leptospira ognonensis TaxID=2484945 RepID=A0A4R9K561_9LEPT|nr:hypothetical protein [Leptospira ognonensis]TGL60304.1 hypothetical protein EHQ58_07355 [Leptospira ognonensis]